MTKKLVQTLLEIPSAADMAGRNAMLNGIPKNVIMALNRSQNPHTDISNLVSQLDAVGRMAESGEYPLIILAENGLMQVQGMRLGEELTGIINELRTHYAGEVSPGKEPEIEKPSSKAFKMKLADALLNCSTMSDRDMRDSVVDELPVEIRHKIKRSNSARSDVLSIVTACMDYEDGISELVEAVRFFEGSAICMKKVDGILAVGYINS